MKNTPWLLLLLALAATVGVWRLLGGGTTRSPLELVAAAQARAEGPSPDLRAALREFDLAVAVAVERGDPGELCEVLRARARHLQARASLREARADLERVLELGAAPPAEVHLELAVVCLVQEDYDDCLLHVGRTLELAPGHGGAYAIQGRAHTALAEQELRMVRATFSESLATVDGQEAGLLADRAAALPTDNVSRASLLLSIEALMPERRRDETTAVRSAIERASAHNQAAREAFAKSLGPGLRADAVLGLLELDLRSGRTADAVDFGLAARLHADVEADARTLQALATGLDRLGRSKAAAIVLTQAVQAGRYMEPGFLPQWCRILYLAEEWPQLLSVAGDLQSRTPDVSDLAQQRAAANFYVGAAARKSGRNPIAQTALGMFVSRAAMDPVKDARGLAWTWLAELEAERGDAGAERRALEQATQASPNLSGESWLRLSELSERAGLSPNTPLRQRTHALRLLPQRIDELLPGWIALGELTLADQARDVERAFEDVVAAGRYVPAGPVSSYELWRYAHLHRDAGSWHGVAAATRVFLEEYPRFLPIFDLSAEAQLRTGKLREYADMLLERLEFLPRSDSEQSKDTLRELRAMHAKNQLEPEQVLLLMRVDPRHTGVLAMARDLLESDQPAVAAKGLMQAGLDTLGDEGRLLLARCELELNRPREVIQILASVGPDSPGFTQALAHTVRAALALSDIDLLDESVAGAGDAEVLNKEPLIVLVDELLVRREWHPAWTLLHQLDSRIDTRGGDVTLRIAVAALVADEMAAAREALERSRAFRGDGAPEMGLLAMSAALGNWARLPAEARDLRRSKFRPDPLADVLLLALEDRLEAAQTAAAKAADVLGDDPRWPLAQLTLAALSGADMEPPARFGTQALKETQAFLRGTPENPQDPRRTLVYLLSLDFPEWALWTLSELADSSLFASSRLWPLYLSTLAEQRLEHRVAFRTLLLELTERFPDFEPGWELLQRAEEERLERLDHPDLTKLRARRRAALGGATAGPETDIDLARAAMAASRGDLATARRLATAAVERSPEDLPARLALAGILARADDPLAAISQYVVFFGEAPPGVAFDHIPEFLELAEGAERRGLIPLGALGEALASLTLRLPADPSLALARANYELRLRPDSPVFAIGRAWSTLENFRAATDHAPLEFLRAGSTFQWLDFYARYDLSRADRFVEAELALQPTSVEMWTVRGALLEAMGRRQEALEHYESLRSMVPDPRVALRIASLLAETGTELARVERELERVRALENRPDDDPELLFVRASGYVLSGPALLDQGIAMLAGLWDERGGRAKSIGVAELGRRYGASLTHRGRVADRSLAEAVLEEAARAAEEPEERQFLRRLATAARHLPVERMQREP